jgi:hypothetical protein
MTKIPINPKLPRDFDDWPNDLRPRSHRKWWNRPYIQTVTWEQMKPRNPEMVGEFRDRWFAAWPSGTRYDVRCLDGGAWDRSTNWGSFATLDEALACASSGAPFRRTPCATKES